MAGVQPDSLFRLFLQRADVLSGHCRGGPRRRHSAGDRFRTQQPILVTKPASRSQAHPVPGRRVLLPLPMALAPGCPGAGAFGPLAVDPGQDRYLVLAIALAYVSKKVVEDPGRTRLLQGANPVRVVMATAAAVAVVCVLCGGLLVSFTKAQDAEAAKLQDLSGGPCFGARSLDPANKCSDPFGAAQVANVGPNEAPWFDAPECHPSADPIISEGHKFLTDCDFTGGAKPGATVWLVGDSHAEQWKSALYELARLHKWKLKESLVGGCPFVDVKRVAFMGVQTPDPQSQQRCLSWSRQLSERIVQEKPDMVFAASFGTGETIDDGTGRSQLDQYNEAVTKRFLDWTSAGSRVYVFRDPPLTLRRSSPDCVALNQQQPMGLRERAE